MPNYEWRFDVVWENLPFMLEGLGMTLAVAVVAMVAALILGLIVALARLSRFRVLSIIATVYTEVLRAAPLLVVILWVFYALPVITGIGMTAYVAACIAYTLNLSAFLAEVYRSGIMSIDRGQTEAALSTGMTNWQVMRRIVLPQAVQRMIPPMASFWVGLFKDTSLVALIGVGDLMYRANSLNYKMFRPMEILTVAALIYFAVTYPQSLIVNRLAKKYQTAA